MRIPLIVGNWKLHGTRASVVQLASEVAAGVVVERASELVVCPSFVHLADVAVAIAGSAVGLGAQNASDQQLGAYTGEVAASMLSEFGCRYVILGHSERRHIYGETDELIAAKFAAVRAAGLLPILCVGETLAEREAGQTEAVVCQQLQVVIDRLGVQAMTDAVLAYEPVWAIGTGKTASPEQAQAVHAVLREKLALQSADLADTCRIVYGGSVKAANAAELFAMPDIDGGLIGGAALQADDFLAIYRSALS